MSPSPVTSRRISGAVAGVLYLGVVVVTFWAERRFGEWWKRNNLLAAPVARVERVEARYRRRSRAITSVTDLNRNLSAKG
jgi:hypothetical protein